MPNLDAVRMAQRFRELIQCPGSTRFTVQPPNPPPIIRAPERPRNRERRIHQKIQLLAAHFVIVLQAAMGCHQQSAHLRKIAFAAGGHEIQNALVLADNVARASARRPDRESIRSCSSVASRKLSPAFRRAAKAHSATRWR